MRVVRRLVLVCSLCVVVLASGAAPAAAAPEPLASCFWEGPISMKRPTSAGFDGRAFNFPEESATYWLARLRIPAGSRLFLDGRFARARYQSLNAYSDGTPTDALTDVAVEPRAGSTNPFRIGARRDARRRAYEIEVVDQPPPAQPADRRANALYAKPGGDVPIELLYRVYEPDRGLDLDGAAGLPVPRLLTPDAAPAGGAQACAAVNDPDRSIPLQTIPAPAWRAARSAPGCDGRTNPAYDPVRWERFFNLDYAQQAVLGDCTAPGRELRLSMAPQEKGGFYSNRDNAYVYAHLSRRFGDVLVVQGRLPTVPRTYGGQGRVPATELRYWSLCTGESRVTLRTPDCVADREVPVDAGRRFTVVVSRAADRPPNARLRCGVAWIDWGDRGDGAGDPDYGLLILRNMLPDPRFGQAVQDVAQPGTEAQVMGEHFPASAYASRDDFAARGCRGSRLAVLGSSPARPRVRCTTTEALCTGRLTARVAGRVVARRAFRVRAGRTRTVRLRVPAADGARVTVTATGRTPVGVRLLARRRF